MNFSWWKKSRDVATVAVEEQIRNKYGSFRQLLSLNNECLDLLAGLQEDLGYVPARRDVVGGRVSAILEKAHEIVGVLEILSTQRYPTLQAALNTQRQEVEAYIAAQQELVTPRLSAWLSEVDARAVSEVGGKAAALGEIKNRLGLPVPDGYVLTTEAYRQFCGIPLWTSIRDSLHDIDPDDLAPLQVVSNRLREMSLACAVPRAVEIAITARAENLETGGWGFAVRSSALGEGGTRTFAGQFLSLLNVPPQDLVDAYKRVVSERFSERALFYRLSAGLLEVESPMAVLFLPVIPARAAGIMYTRDPKNPRSEALWITATHGLGLDIASGRAPADLFVVSRRRAHRLLESNVVRKEEQVVPVRGGGLARLALTTSRADAQSLDAAERQVLADWGVRIEEHFGTPQDVEWVLDERGGFWIVQSRPLALAGSVSRWGRARPHGEPLLADGRTVYPGQVSGRAFMVEDPQSLRNTPEEAVVFMRRASPEIVRVLPRIAGLVAEWGNVAGHAASLLREFKVPSVFQMDGSFQRVKTGDLVSLDASSARVYAGALWESHNVQVNLVDGFGGKGRDPISKRLLTLHLVDPSAFGFRPSRCQSTHDVIRFCHEKAIEAMFALNDQALEGGSHRPKRLMTPVPVNLYVLDLGGGLALEDPESEEVLPSQIVSRPFQGLWKGVGHPGVTWTRDMPATFSDLASVMASSLAPTNSALRALGEKSYLLVADEYMNLNSRLAYHFTLVDACVSDTPVNNYIFFRFAGGGATRERRNLRACFLETCLARHGFLVDRRGDLVNAWFKKGTAAETETRLDILGRLMACSSQLDMYMASHEVMKWYVQQFMEGNYAFRVVTDDMSVAQGQTSKSP
jgi:pyruvate,water dikinase